MNIYQVYSIPHKSMQSGFNGILLALLFSPDLRIEPNLMASKGSNTFNFSLDFSLQNLENVNDYTSALTDGGILQVVNDTRLTNTREFSFKPYSIKGMKVAMLITPAEIKTVDVLLQDLEKDYITFNVAVRNSASEFEDHIFILGTANATQNETYKPFERFPNDTSIIKFFESADVVTMGSCQISANVKPIINLGTRADRVASLK